MSQGPIFKYYFTASMQVCGVILQLFVMYARDPTTHPMGAQTMTRYGDTWQV